MELQDGLHIEDVTKQAFTQLGENGVIRSAENHFCSECTHQYKATADRITGGDSAAVLGIDENHQVPVFQGEGAELAVQDAARADQNPSPDKEASPVKMIVIDGVVIGPTHCAYDDCTGDLQNACGEVFCGFHEIISVTCVTVTIQKFHLVKYVPFIRITGTHMLHDMDSNHYLEFTD